MATTVCPVTQTSNDRILLNIPFTLPLHPSCMSLNRTVHLNRTRTTPTIHGTAIITQCVNWKDLWILTMTLDHLQSIPIQILNKSLELDISSRSLVEVCGIYLVMSPPLFAWANIMKTYSEWSTQQFWFKFQVETMKNTLIQKLHIN